ncbi:MAG: helix-turn-helix domain-containing protein [Anaerolineales bacterium]|jgi:predicted ArsR family transcriptional regulator
MKPTTRFQILEYIRKYQTASVRELSALMGTSGANIRHHLTLLESNDLIERVGMRKEGRGRPRQVFGLSRRVLGDGLDNLSGNLLALWMGSTPDEMREAGLRSLAERLAGTGETSRPGLKQVAGTVARMNELRYQARWEASAAGARIILGHCPYAAIIGNHPELCRMDAMLLEIKLGASVEQTAKLQMSDKGLPFCVFQIVEN